MTDNERVLIMIVIAMIMIWLATVYAYRESIGTEERLCDLRINTMTKTLFLSSGNVVQEAIRTCNHSWNYSFNCDYENGTCDTNYICDR